jgi:hypothetical protein
MTKKRKHIFVNESPTNNPEVKTKVIRALSGEFVRPREDAIGDLGASITMNERETVYHYRDEEYREPTAQATEAMEMNARMMRDYPGIPVARKHVNDKGKPCS